MIIDTQWSIDNFIDNEVSTQVAKKQKKKYKTFNKIKNDYKNLTYDADDVDEEIDDAYDILSTTGIDNSDALSRVMNCNWVRDTNNNSDSERGSDGDVPYIKHDRSQDSKSTVLTTGVFYHLDWDMVYDPSLGDKQHTNNEEGW